MQRKTQVKTPIHHVSESGQNATKYFQEDFKLKETIQRTFPKFCN